GVVNSQNWHLRPARASSSLNVERLTEQDFAERYGSPDTARAIHSFTPAHDTHAVLALLAHCKPLKVLEIGTAAGHMTANLTEWSPEDATVYTIGITRDMAGAG